MVYLYIRADTNRKKILIISSFTVVLIGLLIYIIYTVGVVFGYFKGVVQKDYASNISNLSGSGTCQTSGDGISCNPFGGSGCINQPAYLYYGVPYYFKSVNQRDSNGNKIGYCGGLLPPEGYIGQQIKSGENGNEGWFKILETNTDVTNPAGIFMIYKGDGTLPPSDIPVPVFNGDTITLKNISQNARTNGQFFGSGQFTDRNFCVGSPYGVYRQMNGLNYNFNMLDSVSPNNNIDNKQQLTITFIDGTKNNFILKKLGQEDIFVSCNPSSGVDNYFLIDTFGNNPTCSNNNGWRYIQTSTNNCPDNKISFPSTSCTDWCDDVTDYSNPKPASVWVFSAESVNSN
jgi:hypothetical protein